MEVIKKGDAHLRDAFCERCKSELKYEPKDVYCSTDLYQGIAEKKYVIRCPVCNHIIVINTETISVEKQKPKKKFKFWWCK